MSEPIVWLNDQIVPESQAGLRVFNLGIVLGATVTEMTRTFQHEPFRLDDHIARLYRSMKYTCIDEPCPADVMVRRTLDVIGHNAALIGPDEELGVIHFVTAGESALYANSLTAAEGSTLCIHTFTLPFGTWRHLFTDGAHVVTPSTRHIPPSCLDAKAKNRSRLHWHIASKQAEAVDSAAIPLLLDLDANITECAGSNFVIVRDETICTPTDRNILHGISLQTVEDLAGEAGLGYEAMDLQLYDVIQADEAWLPSTPYCIAPCTRVNTIPIGDSRPGPRWRRMLEVWSKHVGMDIHSQLLGNGR